MSTQSTPESAFIESMRQINGYTEWVDTTRIVKAEEEEDAGHISKEDIEICNKRTRKIVTFESGSYVQAKDRFIYIFTIMITKNLENVHSDYSSVFQAALAATYKNQFNLISLSAKKKGEKDACNVYYLRLVFPRD